MNGDNLIINLIILINFALLTTHRSDLPTLLYMISSENYHTFPDYTQTNKYYRIWFAFYGLLSLSISYLLSCRVMLRARNTSLVELFIIFSIFILTSYTEVGLVPTILDNIIKIPLIIAIYQKRIYLVGFYFTIPSILITVLSISKCPTLILKQCTLGGLCLFASTINFEED